MVRKPKQYEDDDGHTIVNMNVPGMPWYQDDTLPSRRQHRAENPNRSEQLTTGQTIRYTLYSLLASFVVFGFIGGGMILFILILWLCWR